MLKRSLRQEWACGLTADDYQVLMSLCNTNGSYKLADKLQDSYSGLLADQRKQAKQAARIEAETDVEPNQYSVKEDQEERTDPREEYTWVRDWYS